MKFSKSHEYLQPGDPGAVGISEFAAAQLGDVVFVELPSVGKVLAQGQEFGVVESVKAVSSLYAPVAGTVAAINEELVDHPEWVNQDPYGKGWMIKLVPANASEADALLTAEQYQAEVANH